MDSVWCREMRKSKSARSALYNRYGGRARAGPAASLLLSMVDPLDARAGGDRVSVVWFMLN